MSPPPPRGLFCMYVFELVSVVWVWVVEGEGSLVNRDTIVDIGSRTVALGCVVNNDARP